MLFYISNDFLLGLIPIGPLVVLPMSRIQNHLAQTMIPLTDELMNKLMNLERGANERDGRERKESVLAITIF